MLALRVLWLHKDTGNKKNFDNSKMHGTDVKKKYIEYIIVASNTLQLHWLYYSYIEYITATFKTLQLHWIHYSYIEYITVTLNTLQLHWIHYGCIEYITVTLNTLQLHWIHYSCIEYITVTLNWWCTEFIWSTSLNNADARYCLDWGTSRCESRQQFDVQRYVAQLSFVCCFVESW